MRRTAASQMPNANNRRSLRHCKAPGSQTQEQNTAYVLPRSSLPNVRAICDELFKQYRRLAKRKRAPLTNSNHWARGVSSKASVPTHLANERSTCARHSQLADAAFCAAEVVWSVWGVLRRGRDHPAGLPYRPVLALTHRAAAHKLPGGRTSRAAQFSECLFPPGCSRPMPRRFPR